MRSHGVDRPLSLSLPPLKRSATLTEAETRQALRQLHEFSYYPVPEALELDSSNIGQDASAPDSGYASETDADEASKAEKAVPLYLDPIERDFAVRWLTGFIGQAWEFPLSDDTREEFVDAACSLLSHLTTTEDDCKQQDEDPGMTRRFQFSSGDGAQSFVIDLNDTPMQLGDDHEDVGLQTWGASIAFSQMVCTAPAEYLPTTKALDSSMRVIELGAGTGLVSLVLASVLASIAESPPSIIATDYHPAVLKNLERNATSHHRPGSTALVQVALLDWCAPTREPPLDLPADMIVAADVVYAAEHARWLRHCAASLLAPDGVFWLMVSIRPNGKFAGVCDSIEAIFAEQDATAANIRGHLKILNHQWIDKKHNVGRADEIGYKLFRIGWA